MPTRRNPKGSSSRAGGLFGRSTDQPETVEADEPLTVGTPITFSADTAEAVSQALLKAAIDRNTEMIAASAILALENSSPGAWFEPRHERWAVNLIRQAADQEE